MLSSSSLPTSQEIDLKLKLINGFELITGKIENINNSEEQGILYLRIRITKQIKQLNEKVEGEVEIHTDKTTLIEKIAY